MPDLEIWDKRRLEACLFLDVASSRAQTRSGKTRALITSPYQSATLVVSFPISVIFPFGSKRLVKLRRLHSPTLTRRRR